MLSVVTQSIDKGVFYYFRDVTRRKIPFMLACLETLEIPSVSLMGGQRKLLFYYGPRTLKLQNEESLVFFVAANFEFIALQK